MKSNTKTEPLMFANSPEAKAWRRDQANVDADIEGLARNADTEALMQEMTASGLSADEKIQRLHAHVQSKHAEADIAAE